MSTTARTQKKRRIKAGTPVASRKKTTAKGSSRARTSSRTSTRTRAKSRTASTRRKRPSKPARKLKTGSSSKSVSKLRQFFTSLFSVILLLGLLIWTIYSVLLPQWLFSNTQPKNILLVPGNVEVPSDMLLFAHIDQNEKNQRLNLLSGGETVSVIGGYGEYQLQNVYPLLKMDGRDEQYIEAAFNHALGVAVDQVIPVPALTAEILDLGRPGWFFLEQAKENPQHWKELLQFHFLARQAGKINTISLRQFSSSAYQYQTLGAQTARDCPVAVINTTGASGLASDTSGIIEENGGLVVRVTNEHAAFTNSSLYISKDLQEACQPLINLISRIFPTMLQQIPATESMTGEYRAKLILFLGSDAADVFSQQP